MIEILDLMEIENTIFTHLQLIPTFYIEVRTTAVIRS